jgi:trimeric autotransporter adhesin
MRSATLLLCTSLVFLGCGGDGSGVTYPQQAAASVVLTLSPVGALASAGDTRAVTAVVKAADQSVVSSPTLTWTTDAPTVATVSGSGDRATITAVGDGVATITATTGSVAGTVTVTVRRALASVVLTNPTPLLGIGTTAQLVATGLDASGKPLTDLTGVRYESSNPGSVAVSNAGVVTALFAFPALPSAIITATVTRDGVTVSDTAGVTVITPATFDFGSLLLTEYVKPVAVPAAGSGIAYFTVAGARINYTVVWSALSGPAIAVDLHGPAAPNAVGGMLVSVPLDANPLNANYGVAMGSFGAADIRPINGQLAIGVDSLVKLLGNGNAYLDVHTSAFQGGEVRGQVQGPFR